MSATKTRYQKPVTKTAVVKTVLRKMGLDADREAVLNEAARMMEELKLPRTVCRQDYHNALHALREEAGRLPKPAKPGKAARPHHNGMATGNGHDDGLPRVLGVTAAPAPEGVSTLAEVRAARTYLDAFQGDAERAVGLLRAMA